MKDTVAVAQLVLAVCVLAGCTTSVESATDQPPLESSAVETEPETAPSESSAAPSESRDSDTSELQTCPSEVQAAMEASITAQTEALVAGDFELAHSYASPSFQSNVSVESFAVIISSSFSPLMSAADLSFANCLNNQALDLGVIDVRFVESEGNLIGSRYLLVATDDGWRIDAAGNLALIATKS